MVRLVLKDENLRLAYGLLSSLKRLLPVNLTHELAFDDIMVRLREEKEKAQAELDKYRDYLKSIGFDEEDLIKIEIEIELCGLQREGVVERIKSLLGDKVLPDELNNIAKNLTEAIRVESRLRKIDWRLEELDGSQRYGRIDKLKEVFNEIAGLTLIREMSGEEFKQFLDFIERDHDPSHLPLGHIINLLNLEPVSPLEVIRCLDSLVKGKYFDVHQIYSDYSFAATFAFLYVHLTKRGFDGVEMLNEVGTYRWEKFKGSLPIELLAYFIIPLALSKPTNMKSGLALARLFLDQGRHGGTEYLEDICRGLQNIEKYGTDEQVNRIISYVYFYGDLDVIIKLGALAKVEGSLEKAINRLRGHEHLSASRNTSRVKRRKR